MSPVIDQVIEDLVIKVRNGLNPEELSTLISDTFPDSSQYWKDLLTDVINKGVYNKTSAKHSSATDQWFTPTWVIEAVHKTIGYPDLDPASSPEANETVKARRIITKEENGLEADWTTDSSISVFINPPGGKTGKQSNQILFWDRLIQYKQQGFVRDAIFLVFSIEALQTSQVYPRMAMGNFYICIPKRRIAFVSPSGKKNSPTHANAIIYIPGEMNQKHLFFENFSKFGSMLRPM